MEFDTISFFCQKTWIFSTIEKTFWNWPKKWGMISFITIDKFHLACDCFERSIVNSSRKFVFHTLGLDVAQAYMLTTTYKIRHHKKITTSFYINFVFFIPKENFLNPKNETKLLLYYKQERKFYTNLNKSFAKNCSFITFNYWN